MLLESLLRSA